LDRKIDDIFYDGHDELYHHAKFGKDRTTRAGCRCENVVFVFLNFFLPAGLPRRGKLPVLFLLTGQKIVFFAPQGRLVAPIQVKLCSTDVHLGPLGCAKFQVNRCRRVGMRPQNIKNFQFLVKSRPTGATPLTDFQNF